MQCRFTVLFVLNLGFNRSSLAIKIQLKVWYILGARAIIRAPQILEGACAIISREINGIVTVSGTAVQPCYNYYLNNKNVKGCRIWNAKCAKNLFFFWGV